MPTSFEALQVILYLLPGFVTLKVKELLSFPSKASEINRAIDGVVFTFLNLFVFFTIKVLFSGELFSIGYLNVAGLFFIAIFHGLILGNNYLTAKFYQFLRWLRLTYRTPHVDAWSEAFNNIRGVYVKVCFADGRKYIGWPRYYSDDPELKDLFLADAHFVSITEEVTKIEGPGVLVSGGSDITVIEFLNPFPQQEEIKMGDKQEMQKKGSVGTKPEGSIPLRGLVSGGNKLEKRGAGDKPKGQAPVQKQPEQKQGEKKEK